MPIIKCKECGKDVSTEMKTNNLNPSSIKEKLKSIFFVSWMLLPIYLTKRGMLFNNYDFDFNRNLIPWIIFLFYLFFLFKLVPLIEKKIHIKLQKTHIPFFHSSVLSLVLLFTYGANITKFTTIWMVALIQWILYNKREHEE